MTDQEKRDQVLPDIEHKLKCIVGFYLAAKGEIKTHPYSAVSVFEMMPVACRFLLNFMGIGDNLSEYIRRNDIQIDVFIDNYVSLEDIQNVTYTLTSKNYTYKAEETLKEIIKIANKQSAHSAKEIHGDSNEFISAAGYFVVKLLKKHLYDNSGIEFPFYKNGFPFYNNEYFKNELNKILNGEVFGKGFDHEEWECLK